MNVKVLLIVCHLAMSALAHLNKIGFGESDTQFGKHNYVRLDIRLPDYTAPDEYVGGKLSEYNRRMVVSAKIMADGLRMLHCQPNRRKGDLLMLNNQIDRVFRSITKSMVASGVQIQMQMMHITSILLMDTDRQRNESVWDINGQVLLSESSVDYNQRVLASANITLGGSNVLHGQLNQQKDDVRMLINMIRVVFRSMKNATHLTEVEEAKCIEISALTSRFMDMVQEYHMHTRDYLQLYRTAIVSLLHGVISPEIVSPKVLQRVLGHVTSVDNYYKRQHHMVFSYTRESKMLSVFLPVIRLTACQLYGEKHYLDKECIGYSGMPNAHMMENMCIGYSGMPPYLSMSNAHMMENMSRGIDIKVEAPFLTCGMIWASLLQSQRDRDNFKYQTEIKWSIDMNRMLGFTALNLVVISIWISVILAVFVFANYIKTKLLMRELQHHNVPI